MEQQQVRGGFTTEFYWKIPKGIDLNDEETYEYYQQGNILYLSNKKTGEEWEIEAYYEQEHDFRTCDYLEVEEADSDFDDSSDDSSDYEYPLVKGGRLYINWGSNENKRFNQNLHIERKQREIAFRMMKGMKALEKEITTIEKAGGFIEKDSSDDDDFDCNDSCDCCVKGWSKANEYGRCECRCSGCKNPLRTCRYECYEKAEKEDKKE